MERVAMRASEKTFLLTLGSLVFLLMTSLIARGGGDINAVDENGLKQGFWKITGSISLEAGYRSNQVVEEGHFEDDKKTGLWKKYYPTGKLRNEITFKNNHPRGPYKIYFPNGNLEEQGNWQGNKNIGEFKRYHENGTLSQDFSFSASGKRDGLQNYFYENGNLQLSVEVVDGVAHGVYKTYYPDGNMKGSKEIVNGQVDENSVEDFAPAKAEYAFLESPETPEKINHKETVETPKIKAFKTSGETALYNHRKQVTQIGEFKNGRLWNGKWHRYGPDGALKKVEVYQEGKFIGYGLLEAANN